MTAVNITMNHFSCFVNLKASSGSGSRIILEKGEYFARSWGEQLYNKKIKNNISTFGSTSSQLISIDSNWYTVPSAVKLLKSMCNTDSEDWGSFGSTLDGERLPQSATLHAPRRCVLGFTLGMSQHARLVRGARLRGARYLGQRRAEFRPRYHRINFTSK